MALINKKLTEREKAALIMYVYGYCQDWRKLYAIAVDTSHDLALRDINIAVYASRWKNTAKVREFLAKEKERREIWLGKERERIAGEIREQTDSVCTEKEKRAKITNFVDYSDPDNRKQLYNQVIAASIDDPKTQLDAAKMFEQIQRDDKQAAREQRQVRAYLPITCDICPLYQRAKKRSSAES